MKAGKIGGLKLKIGRYNFRIWKFGFEVDNGKNGRTYFFPWAPIRGLK